MDTPIEKDWTTTTIMQQQLHENFAENPARTHKKQRGCLQRAAIGSEGQTTIETDCTRIL